MSTMTHEPPDALAIPAVLRPIPQWLVWDWGIRDGKPTKLPIDAATGYTSDATTPGIWMALDAAIVAAEGRGGIGFAVTAADPFTGIDLDQCLDEKGRATPEAEAVVERFDSYTEITPSGRGLRIWVRGKLPPGRRRKGRVELYDQGRFFTFTGKRWPGSPLEIEERSGELARFHAEIFPPAEPPRESREPSAPHSLDDRAILDRMFKSKNGAKIEALYRGDRGGYASESEADLALCGYLSFWTQGDKDAIDRLFRTSALVRGKWTERADYRERTIARAVEGGNFYDPGFGRLAPRIGNGGGHNNGDGGDDGGEGGGGGADRPAEAPDNPHRLARVFLETRHTRFCQMTLRFWNEQWHTWDGCAWRPRLEKEINAELTRAIKVEFDRIAEETGSTSKAVTTSTLGNAALALRDLAILKMNEAPGQPCWIGPTEPGEDLPDPREVLPARNALIHLPSLVAGEPYLIRPTPQFFSPNSLGYDFNPLSSEPSAWLDFLAGLWPDDPGSVESLQEWFGYMLTPDTSQQKMLMLIGPKRSGKGTIGRVLRALVGPDNVAAPTLSGLAMNFGLAPLIGKTVALIADARLSGRADGQVIVERLLSISGEDAQEIDRKHLSSWNGSLPTRFVLISNELPRLGDSSGALPSRMILLRLTRSFYGQEDHALTEKLLAERPAILRWAIEGWQRLHERGRFLQPASGRELIDDLDELSSPVGTFVAERCHVGPDLHIDVPELFAAWKSYCSDKGKTHPGDEQGFGRNLRAVLPELRISRPREGGLRVRRYQGITLNDLLGSADHADHADHPPF